MDNRKDIWSALSAPLTDTSANGVRERLDSVVPGEHDFTLDLLPPDHSEPNTSGPLAFKGRMQILGVIREAVGQGNDYKGAATDAFVESARLFGIGTTGAIRAGEYAVAGGLTETSASTVQAIVRSSGPVTVKPTPAPTPAAAPAATPAPAPAGAYPDGFDPENPLCPKCGGKCWDNRVGKKNPKSPDFRCRDKDNCDGVVWPPKPSSNLTAPIARAVRSDPNEYPAALLDDDEDGLGF